MRKWIAKQWKRRPRPLGFLWRWADRGDRKEEPRRWKVLAHFTANRAHTYHVLGRKARERGDNKLAEKHFKTSRAWEKRRPIYRRRKNAAKRRLKRWRKRQHDAAPKYATWMLSGASGNIDDDLKPVVAYLVVECDQWITDTYDYGGHTSTSLHYPRNDPTSPQQGRAVDAAGPDMCGAQTKVAAKFDNNFLELFGPCPWYLKFGDRISIQPFFPGHGDHLHAGRA